MLSLLIVRSRFTQMLMVTKTCMGQISHHLGTLSMSRCSKSGWGVAWATEQVTLGRRLSIKPMWFSLAFLRSNTVRSQCAGVESLLQRCWIGSMDGRAVSRVCLKGTLSQTRQAAIICFLLYSLRFVFSSQRKTKICITP
jgi:hypothetical protein